MAIKTFRAIGKSVSLVLENNTVLFSSTLDKIQIDSIHQSALGILELNDEQLIEMFERNNLSKMESNEKEAIEDKVLAKVISTNDNKYGHLFDNKDGVMYRRGVNLSIPKFVFKRYISLLETFSEKSNEFKAIDNFWYWSSLNPNKYAREELLEFLQKGDFLITPNGYFVAYRNVKIKEEKNKKLTDFISEQYMRVKTKLKKSPANYIITQYNNEYKLEKSTDTEPMGETIGNLKELNDNIANLPSTTVYTDAHTGKMIIKLGKEVRIDRKDCDESSDNDCSRGLHVGNKNFAFNDFGNTGLVCLVNPMNVVAVPKYNQNKMRTCAYFPMAVRKDFNDNDFSQFDSEYFDEQVLRLKQLAKDNKPEEVNVNIISSVNKSLKNISATVKGRINKI